jgi:hypothetical protein
MAVTPLFEFTVIELTTVAVLLVILPVTDTLVPVITPPTTLAEVTVPVTDTNPPVKLAALARVVASILPPNMLPVPETLPDPKNKLPPVIVPVALTVFVAISTPDASMLPPVTLPVALTVFVDISTPDAIKLAPVTLPDADIVAAFVLTKAPNVVIVTL